MAAPVMIPPKGDARLHPESWDELASIELVDSDGENMDSDWHRDCMNLLIESVRHHLADRTDYFVGGNMFIYFNAQQARNRDFHGPDFFYVSGRPLQPQRRWWAIWEEDWRFPNAIIELISPSTEDEDRNAKFTVYEQTFHTPEYFLYDPDTEKLNGFRLTEGRYLPIEPDERGWLWSEQFQLWIGTWRGVFHSYNVVWLRFYHPDGRLVLIGDEAERARAEEARKQAETAKKQTEEARKQTEAAQKLVEAAQKRAEAAEAELARLKAQLAPLPKPNGPS